MDQEFYLIVYGSNGEYNMREIGRTHNRNAKVYRMVYFIVCVLVAIIMQTRYSCRNHFCFVTFPEPPQLSHVTVAFGL